MLNNQPALESFAALPRKRRDGSEPFHDEGTNQDFDLLSFWQWGYSDIMSNTLRGVLAEYLVAQAMGAVQGIREEWAPYDLVDPNGVTIEITSAAYLQTWYQPRLSKITFACPKTKAWDPAKGKYEEQSRRQAQVYVFALLAHTEQDTLDPFNLAQWRFFVMPTAVLTDRVKSQHSITLKTLLGIHGPAVSFRALKDAVGQAGETHSEETLIL
jgi:hypothetical protein